MKQKKKKEPISQKDIVDLTLGTRKPRTKKEKELQKDIDDIIAKGRIVDIPNDIF